MERDRLRNLLTDVATGATDVNEALRRLETLPFEDLGFARLDHHRALRCGFPEVVFGLGKTPQQIEEIFVRLAARGASVLGTRITPESAALVAQRLPTAEYHPLPRTLRIIQSSPEAVQVAAPDTPLIGVVCAGTSDLPVAEEARITAETLGCPAWLLADVGVAGLHRLLASLDELRRARVLIVVAGMEGALPSVVGGLVDIPVIAVPTSIGYGASFNGLAALLSMLNTCASGVSVVNIDNGFGAGYQAAMICRTMISQASPQVG